MDIIICAMCYRRVYHRFEKAVGSNLHGFCELCTQFRVLERHKLYTKPTNLISYVLIMYTEDVKRFRKVVNDTVDEVDKLYLRELQADSHECAAICCRDKDSSTETLLNCVENCGEKLQNAQRIVLKEFDRLEDRFERCLSSCVEFVRESRVGEPNEAEDSVMYDGCVRRCVDSNIEIIPDLLRAINEAFKKSL